MIKAGAITVLLAMLLPYALLWSGLMWLLGGFSSPFPADATVPLKAKEEAGP